MAPKLTVTPQRALVTDQVSVVAMGLIVGRHYRIVATCEDKNGVTWESSVNAVANAEGRIDLASSPALDGSTYRGVDQTGFLWSMRTNSGTRYAIAIDGTQRVTLALWDGAEKLATAHLERTVSLGHEETEVSDEGLRGTFTSPATGSPPYPSVVTLHGSDGGRPINLGRLLAAKGIASLNLTYFGQPDLPERLKLVPVEYVATAVDWLTNRPDIDARRIGIVGASRGGELALLAGSLIQTPVAVVALVPSSVVWQAIGPGPESSWSWQGRPVPFASSTERFYDRAWMRLRTRVGKPVSLRPFLDGGRLSARQVAASRIEVERIKGPVLLISATDDQVWSSTRFSEIAMEGLKGHQFETNHVTLPGAGHNSTGLPGFPTTAPFPVMQGMSLTPGGSPEADARSRVIAWNETLSFLTKHLA